MVVEVAVEVEVTMKPVEAEVLLAKEIQEAPEQAQPTCLSSVRVMVTAHYAQVALLEMIINVTARIKQQATASLATDRALGIPSLQVTSVLPAPSSITTVAPIARDRAGIRPLPMMEGPLSTNKGSRCRSIGRRNSTRPTMQRLRHAKALWVI